jgi:hypothetical protein
MKKSTIANVAQLQLTLPASGNPGAPVVGSVLNPGNYIVQINIDRANNATYAYFRIKQNGRVIFPIDTFNIPDAGNNGFFVTTSITQMFVNIPISPDDPLTIEAFNSGAGTIIVLITIITASESQESLLLQILNKLEAIAPEEESENAPSTIER